MKKKQATLTTLFAVLMIAALMLGLVACGQAAPTTGTTTASGTTAPTATTTAAAEKVTLRMITWVQETNERGIADVNTAFTAKYPNVTIVVDTVGANDYPTLQNTRIAAGDVDIITNLSAFDALPQDFTKGASQPAWETFILGGSYLDLTDQEFIKNWDPNMIKNAVSYKGKVYGISMGSVGFNGLFYNKKLFTDNGLDEPGTWAEFEAACKTFQAKGIAPITLGGADAWPLTAIAVSGIVGANETDMTAFAKGLWEGTRKFTDEQTMKIWKRMDQFVSFLEPNVNAVSYGDAPGRFVAGKAAMLYDGTWNAGTIAALDPSFEFGYFPVPGDVDGNPNQLQGKYDMQFNIYAKTANKEWALKYLEHLSTPEVYGPFVSTLGFFPTMPGVETTSAFVNSLADKNTNFQPAWEKVIIPPKGAGQYAAGLCFNIGQLKILGGTVGTVEELAQLAQDDWDAAVAAIP